MAPPKKTYLKKTKTKNHKFVVKVSVPKPSDFTRRIGPPCQEETPKKKKKAGKKLEFSDIPADLVETILERLCSADRIRFGATSKKNLSCVTSYLTRHEYPITDRIPWLAEFCRYSSGFDFRLFEPLHLHGRPHYATYEIHNPKGEEGLGSGTNARLKSSSKGWFLCLWPKQEGEVSTSFLLFSPLNKRIIKLPDFDHCFFTKYLDVKECVATFSSDPSSPDCVYFFLFQNRSPRQTLFSTLLRQRGRRWKTKSFDAISEWHIQTAVYHEGCFYCLSIDGRLAAYDVLRQTLRVIIPSSPLLFPSGKYHILVCEGKLLLAFVGNPPRVGYDMERLLCGLFEFSSSTRMWVQRKSVGNHALFLGDHTSFAVPVSSSSLSSCDENIADRMYFYPSILDQVRPIYYSFKDGRCHAPKEGGYWSCSTGLAKRGVWIEPPSPPELA